MTISSYKNLIVWQKAIDLVDEIYKLTHSFPKEELYGLISQMQRAAVSIPSNIAEGQSRNHLGEYIQFLGISFGSCAELETQVIIAKKQYPQLDYKKSETLLIEVQKMLNTLISKLKANPRSKT